jgi:hypothetical protein
VTTGTWTPPSSVKGWTRIMVQVPNVGAWDPEANYQINTGSGLNYAIVNQADQTNTWVSLGIYNLAAGANVSLSNVTYLGLGYDVAWDAAAFIPVSGPGVDYVAMGDSYSSGEGNQPYDANSDYSSGDMTDACHRSTTGAYARMVTMPGQSTPIATQAQTLSGNADFHFIACSGAESPNVSLVALNDPPSAYDAAGNTDWGAPRDKINQYGEGIQDEQGDLTSRTTLVTLTIGGNDARFSDVVTACLTQAVNPLTTTTCSSPSYVLTRSNGATDPSPLVLFEVTVIDQLQSHLVDVYEEIHARAPNARIVVLGYPAAFQANPQSSCKVGPGLAGVGAYLNTSDQSWLNGISALLNTTIGSAVTIAKTSGANIDFINPTQGFASHELCSASPWIYGVQLLSNTGSGFSFVDPGSFHPTVAGQEEYATLVNECLAGTISC